MSVPSSGACRGRSRGSIAVVPVVLSALMVMATGCHRSEPGVGTEKRHTTSVEPGGPGMLLGAGDLGANWHGGDVRTELPPWPWEQNDCPAYQSSDYAAKSHRLAASERYYRPSDGSSLAHHVVETYEPGWAERNVDDVRRVLQRCASYLVQGARVSFEVVDPRYLGDAGILVRGRIGRDDRPATVTYVVILRRGETVSTVRVPELGSQAALDSIAAKAVARLG
ncbi:hypothetical protein [Micromonospora chokoriensis]|uniref:PknH-like extracellular domain-containing protein n=1 Tax=Micromonospora chokoriensis TaxID=356851 RepID=A0A1C4XCP4_9ACTN|nr:hypothetical protein [Micromonospora chokoriensis]SCF06205.1 hypothetical protein GA0070612_3453 [Micromonospora chokoriensis]